MTHLFRESAGGLLQFTIVWDSNNLYQCLQAVQNAAACLVTSGGFNTCVLGGQWGGHTYWWGAQPENVHFILQTTVSTIYQFFAKCLVHTRYRQLHLGGQTFEWGGGRPPLRTATGCNLVSVKDYYGSSLWYHILSSNRAKLFNSFVGNRVDKSNWYYYIGKVIFNVNYLKTTTTLSCHIYEHNIIGMSGLHCDILWYIGLRTFYCQNIQV